MATISLCMIVKNEERVLARCLEGVKAAVDEIVIVDTGSSDKTKEIARQYTDKVFDFEWIDDFSAARNFAFSKGEMDFLMWLDADDVVTPKNCAKLTELKADLEDTDVVMMKYNTAFDEDGNPTFSYFRERIVRRTLPHQWKGRVHEAIECKGVRLYTDVAIEHRSVKTTYGTRNLEIYEKQAASGEKMQPRDTFYYGRELYYHKMYDKAIKILSSFLADENGWTENKIEACKVLSLASLEVGNAEKSFEFLFNSFKFDTPRAEICCSIGELFMKQGDYGKAIFWFELALTLPRDESRGGFTDINAYGYLPCIQLCVCFDKLKNYAKAEEYNNRAGAYRPNSEAYLHNLKYFNDLHQKGII